MVRAVLTSTSHSAGTRRRAQPSWSRCLIASLMLWACAADPAAGRLATGKLLEPAPSADAPAPTTASTPASDAAVMEVAHLDAAPKLPAEPEPALTDAGIAERPPQPITPVAVPIEDPSGNALRWFHAALARAGAGEGQARIAFFGASHVASDLFTNVIRRKLQTRFGDAGAGFVPVAKPWRWHNHGRVEYLRSRRFKGARVKARRPKRDRYGLMGVAMDTGKLRGTARIRTRSFAGPDGPTGAVDHFELYYLQQPGGGRVRVMIDGIGVKTLDTAADTPTAAYKRFNVTVGEHTFELRTLADGPVRIFGVVIERTAPGVVLDTLGIPGARARYHLHWDDTLYRAHLARRRPDLVVLAYGTNEAGDDDVPIAGYEKRLRRVLRRIQEIAPDASCLLVGPSDRPKRQEDESYAPRPRTGLIVESQRKLSAEFGCGFYDLVGFMGGPMSMPRWVAADPRMGAPDHVHFTRKGYEALGEYLHDAMMQGYEAVEAEYRAASEVPPASQP